MGALKDIVEQLAGKRNKQRLKELQTHLQNNSLEYMTEKFWFSGTNIYIDILGKNRGKKILLISHHDCVRGSPGANDNASAVATLVGIACNLKQNTPDLPVRIVFFDKEENHLMGSRAYVSRHGVEDICAVLNMELVGEGTYPVFWPFQYQSTQYMKAVSESALVTDKPAYFLPLVIGHSGDHESFQRAGITDSICLTLAHEDDVSYLNSAVELSKKIFSEGSPQDQRKAVETIKSIMSTSKTLRNYHKKTDDPSEIHESSLELAMNIGLEFVKQYSKET